MAGRLDGRKVIVTGAARGMGREVARLFGEEGAQVALLDRDGEAVMRAAGEVGGHGLSCDVAERGQVQAAVAFAAQAMGGVDGLVNAAGILAMAPVGELEPELFERMLAVNVMGVFHMVQAVLPWFEQAEAASIVTLASVSTVMPMPGSGGYSASKAAVAMLTRCMAMDLGPKVRANSILPGFIQTDMTRHLWEDPDHARNAADRVAAKRLGQAEDVARAALYLTSSESSFVTGTQLLVDGGFAWR